MPIEIDIRENALYKAGEGVGEARGRAQGEALGKVVAILEFRFGTLPAEFHQRLDQATINQLERWFQLAHTSDTLELVFSD